MNSVTIPGPYKFFRTYDVPPIEVPLPMVVAADVPTLVLKAVVAGLAGIISLFLGTVLFWLILTSDRLWQLSSVITLVCLLGSSAVCVAFTFKCVRLAQDPQAQLEITAEDVFDRRQDARVAWSNVRHMSTISNKQGWSVIRLRLHAPVQRRPVVPHLYLGLSSLYSDDRFDIAIRMLDARPYILVHTMAALVRMHGGTTEELTQWGWN
ncbi:hypothetical protein [Methylobacterium sp. NFXW15]|uniref:hypothetical protein n=1 Tax=Methylobacterium sp. NFXW15 TaxID=2819512 RepID=UPI003CF0A873